MSQLKTNAVQLGDNTTAANNFVLRTNNDGTLTLARGNVGTTTQDLMTVDASGHVRMPASVGSVLQVHAVTDVGSSTIATGYTNLTGSLINFTPKSGNSKLIIEASGNVSGPLLASNNPVGYLRFYESTVAGLFGAEQIIYNFTPAGGSLMQGPFTMRAILTNAALAARAFGVAGKNNVAPTNGITFQSVVWTITEIQA